MLEDARVHCEALAALVARETPLARVPLSDNVADAHTKIQYMLKDGLGVLHARVLEVDRVNQQLIACGERSSLYYPLAAKSITAAVVRTGDLKYLRNPISAPDFDKHIDGGGGAGIVDDLLVVPIMAASDNPLSHNIFAAADGCHQQVGDINSDHCAPIVIAVCQVSH